MTDNSERDIFAAPSRRSFLRISTASAALPLTTLQQPQHSEVSYSHRVVSPLSLPVRLSVNGRESVVYLDGRATLLDALREKMGLTGTKKGCDQGQCGSCTVHIDGTRRLSCLTLAASASGSEVVTVEGLHSKEGLHPMQQAFIDNDALQCGYCTPGQIMSAVCLTRELALPSDDQIREYMSGNLCRCAAYPNIVAAIRQVVSSGAHI